MTEDSIRGCTTTTLQGKRSDTILKGGNEREDDKEEQ